MIGRSPNDTEHEIVGHRDTRRTHDVAQDPVDGDVEAHDVTEETIGTGELLGHYGVTPNRSSPYAFTAFERSTMRHSSAFIPAAVNSSCAILRECGNVPSECG